MFYQQVFAAAGLAFCLFQGAAAAQTSQDLPPGRGRAQFTQICSRCHGLEMATKVRKTADGWFAVVDDMVSRGAQGTDDDFDLVVAYLSAHFAPKVNVNKAAESELAAVLQISSADAEAIVHYRESAGSIKDWTDLEKVPHIDIKKIEGEKDLIEFSTTPASPAGK